MSTQTRRTLQNFTTFAAGRGEISLPLRVNLPDFPFISPDLHGSSDTVSVPHTAAENGKKLSVSRRQVGLYSTREKIPVVSPDKYDKGM